MVEDTDRRGHAVYGGVVNNIEYIRDTTVGPEEDLFTDGSNFSGEWVTVTFNPAIPIDNFLNAPYTKNIDVKYLSFILYLR